MARTSKTAADTMSEAFESVNAKMEIPAAARDFVKRGAAAAQERTAELHESLSGATARAENLATAAVTDYADFTRAIFGACLANMRHALTTVEKVAGATSFGEAVQIQSDFVRESAAANYERAREAAEAVRARFADGAKSFQDEVSTLVARKAA